MSRYWLKSEIVEKIERDLDLEEELFIQDTEMLAYINEAIDEAEAEIHSSYEDYFLTNASIVLVNGTNAYSLPTDIYANKIRSVIYRNGTIVFPVPRERDSKKFLYYESNIANTSTSTCDYRYFLVNTTAGTPQIYFTPTPAESGSYIKIWYYRNANRLVADSDVCDIPEFANFVIQYVKVRCYEKEVGHPNLQMAIGALEQQREQMKATLATMVPDGNNEIEMDLSSYEEQEII